ncbi:MAG: NADH-quinone oxidoreductase subunit NuoE [Candidatus Bathyarchaeia archaeon]
MVETTIQDHRGITREILSQYSSLGRDMLIPVLQEVQEKLGYLSREAIEEISSAMSLPTSKIYGVATFYNQFRFEPVGKYHIQVCRGTACHVKGSSNVLEALQRELKINPGQCTRDRLFSLEVVACIGACGLSPAISVNGKVHAKVTVKDIPSLLNYYRTKAKEEENAL